MSFIKYIPDETVKSLLKWDALISTLETALKDISKKDDSAIVPPRVIMYLPDKEGAFLAMPGYSKNECSLGCKLVTSFPSNKNLGIPSIFATILLLDPDTGKPRAIMDGTHITGWRTAAASAVATKHLHQGPKDVLAILGSGVQAETHALALNHLFNFKEIRIWSRNKENAERLASSLPFPCAVFDSAEACVTNADVVCTTTYASEPILRKKWLKAGSHINAVGAGKNHYSELEEDIYRNAFIAVEHLESANKELKGLLDKGIKINCEVGELISKSCELPLKVNFTVFQSMGIAIEDVTAANLVYNAYLNKMEETA